MNYDMIVVGEGTAALNFLWGAAKGTDHNKFAGITNKNVLVIGMRDLWLGYVPYEPFHPLHPRIGHLALRIHRLGLKLEVEEAKLSREELDTLDLEMGQPFEFLYTLDHWSDWQNHGIYAAAKTKGSRDYLRAGEYAALEQQLKDALPGEWAAEKTLKFETGEVTSIAKDLNTYNVVRKTGKSDSAPQVIVASGLKGDRRSAATQQLNALAESPDVPRRWGWKRSSGLTLTFDRWLNGTDYITTSNSPPGPDSSKEFVVAVEGAAPVASWAVTWALANGATKIIWLSHYALGGSSFALANAWGRNASIIAYAAERKWMRIGKLTNAVVVNGGGEDAPTIQLKIEPVKTATEFVEAAQGDDEEALKQAAIALDKITKLPFAEDDKFEDTLRSDPYFQTTFETVHQYIDASGQVDGYPDFIQENFAGELEPIRDDQNPPRLSPANTPAEDRAVIALSDNPENPANALTVIGAAMFGILRSMGDERGKKLLTDAKKVLAIYPKIAQVDSGIAATRAALKVLTGFVEHPLTDDKGKTRTEFNWNATDVVETMKFLDALLEDPRSGNSSTQQLAEIFIFGNAYQFPARKDGTFGHTFKDVFTSYDEGDSLLSWLATL